jgi:hypothetical protein
LLSVAGALGSAFGYGRQGGIDHLIWVKAESQPLVASLNCRMVQRCTSKIQSPRIGVHWAGFLHSK